MIFDRLIRAKFIHLGVIFEADFLDAVGFLGEVSLHSPENRAEYGVGLTFVLDHTVVGGDEGLGINFGVNLRRGL